MDKKKKDGTTPIHGQNNLTYGAQLFQDMFGYPYANRPNRENMSAEEKQLMNQYIRTLQIENRSRRDQRQIDKNRKRRLNTQ